MEFTTPHSSHSFVTFSLLEVPAAPTIPQPLYQDEGSSPMGVRKWAEALRAGRACRDCREDRPCSFWWARRLEQVQDQASPTADSWGPDDPEGQDLSS